MDNIFPLSQKKSGDKNITCLYIFIRFPAKGFWQQHHMAIYIPLRIRTRTFANSNSFLYPLRFFSLNHSKFLCQSTNNNIKNDILITNSSLNQAAVLRLRQNSYVKWLQGCMQGRSYWGGVGGVTPPPISSKSCKKFGQIFERIFFQVMELKKIFQL